MAKPKPLAAHVETLREYFSYDPETGIVALGLSNALATDYPLRLEPVGNLQVTVIG